MYTKEKYAQPSFFLPDSAQVTGGLVLRGTTMLMGLSVGREEEKMGVLLPLGVRGLGQPICLTEDGFLNLSRTVTRDGVEMEKDPVRTKQYL